MYVKTLVRGPFSTNTYLVSAEEPRQGKLTDCVVIDPASAVSPLTAAASALGLRIAAVLLTHAHIDHIGALDEFDPADGIPVYVGRGDKGMLTDTHANLSAIFDEPYTYTGTAFPVCDGETVEAAGLSFCVIETPGHTPGSVSYLVESGNTIFSGDTLFRGTVGRTDFPGGNMDTLMRSVQKLMLYEDNRILLPGHEEPTDIGHERLYNPYVSDR